LILSMGCTNSTAAKNATSASTSHTHEVTSNQTKSHANSTPAASAASHGPSQMPASPSEEDVAVKDRENLVNLVVQAKNVKISLIMDTMYLKCNTRVITL